MSTPERLKSCILTEGSDSDTVHVVEALRILAKWMTRSYLEKVSREQQAESEPPSSPLTVVRDPIPHGRDEKIG